MPVNCLPQSQLQEYGEDLAPSQPTYLDLHECSTSTRGNSDRKAKLSLGPRMCPMITKGIRCVELPLGLLACVPPLVAHKIKYSAPIKIPLAGY